MKTATAIIYNRTGLHARPARIFVDTAKKFKSTIHVQHGKKKANAKSIISLLTLGAERGAEIQIIADGEDEDAAVAELVALVTGGLGEEEPAPAPAAQKSPQAVSSEQVAAPAAQKSPQAVSSEQVAAPAAPVVSGNVLQGHAAAPGIAIGPVWQWQAPAKLRPDPTFRSVEAEQEALANALAKVSARIRELADRIEHDVGAEEAAIFAAHLEILHDPDLLQAVHDLIAQHKSASVAWQESIERRAQDLESLSDPLLAARAADVRDVGRLVLRTLLGVPETGPTLPDHPVILLADDLSPSDTAGLDKRRILGFCTARGTPTAHMAILARALGLPAVVGGGEQVLRVPNGTIAILDGERGTLTINPDETALQAARRVQEDRKLLLQVAQQAASEPAITKDGHRVEVVANIGAPAEAVQAVQMGAEGVGLLRTEFLFLQRTQPPTEDEQTAVYRQVAEAMQGRPVIIRTLDVGGDKPLPYLPMAPEANPFLGIRGIRLSLQQPDLLRQQLRAIVRAASAGPVYIMFPMIATLEEWRQARALLDEVVADTGASPIPTGIMIEVPAAALMADIFAPEVDFFSIGTNDLTQYTLAMDRQHAQLAAQADGLHPSVLRLIARTVEAAHAAGKWVGVCGELGADLAAIPILVGLGVDELSVSVPSVPLVKAHIRRLDYQRCQALAQQALECATAAAVRQLVHEFMDSQ